MPGGASSLEQPFDGSRRQALIFGSCAAAAGGLPGLVKSAAPAGLIDVHHHVRPGGRSSGRPVSDILADMDRNGIAAAIGFIGYGSIEQFSASDIRLRNEKAAELVQDHPTRFGLFAALPMLDVDASLAEIARCADAKDGGGSDGFGVSTSYGEAWLGDLRFQPIWAELNRRKAVVFVHPFDAPCCTPATLTYETPPIYGPWIEWPMNTARTILSLMVTGTLRRYPGIRFIFAHGGGVMPLLVERIAGFKDWAAVAPEGPAKLKEIFPDGIEAEFVKLYFECAQAFAPPNLLALMSLAPPAHILFGTDYASFPMSHSVDAFRKDKLPPAIREAIGRGNALRLFPRLQSAAATHR